jgi:hypothetical protein
MEVKSRNFRSNYRDNFYAKGYWKLHLPRFEKIAVYTRLP